MDDWDWVDDLSLDKAIGMFLWFVQLPRPELMKC